ncbi:hypothetical protein ACOMHN_031512 [Nucella lapillus]
MATAENAPGPASHPVEECRDMSDEDGFRNDTGDDDEDDDDDPLLQVAVGTVVSRNRKLVLPEIPSFLYFVALVIQYPVQQFWLFDHFSGELSLNSTSTDYCSNESAASSFSTHNSSGVENEVQSLTNKYVMYISFVGSFTAIFPTLFLGPMTDKFGRKFVFYISFLALFASEALTLVVYWLNLSPVLLLVSSFVLGLSGSYGLYLAAAFGMVADISSAGKQRTLRVATLEATIALGASLGLTTSGIWVQDAGYVWPMAFSLGLILLAAVFFFFFVPETYVERHHQPFSCKTLVRSLNVFVKDSSNGRRIKLILLLSAFSIFVACQYGESNFGTLYLLHQPFCWRKEFISIYSGTYTLLKWMVIMALIHLCRRWVSEPVFALLGASSSGAYYLIIGLASSNVLIFVGTGAGLLADIISPMCRTMMSKAVSQSEQGMYLNGVPE